ncbi:MAG: phosphatase PAP2 family protein [Rudaea sp.]
MLKRLRSFTIAVGLLVSSVASAGIDHRVAIDESGIWSRNVQKGVENTLVVGEVAGALIEGGESRLGKTFWQALDSSAIASISAEAMKHVFTRARPSQTDDPNQWFEGSGHYSFPSGEVTTVTSIVTPFMLEYGHDYPAVYGLALLPIYDGIARVKSQGHWQTDVLASWALGIGTAYFAHTREHPLILGVLPHGFTVGIRRSF